MTGWPVVVSAGVKISISPRFRIGKKEPCLAPLAVNVRASFQPSCRRALSISAHLTGSPASLGDQGEVGATGETGPMIGTYYIRLYLSRGELTAHVQCMMYALCTLPRRGIYSSTIDLGQENVKKQIYLLRTMLDSGLESGGVRCHLSSSCAIMPCGGCSRSRLVVQGTVGKRNGRTGTYVHTYIHTEYTGHDHHACYHFPNFDDALPCITIYGKYFQTNIYTVNNGT